MLTNFDSEYLDPRGDYPHNGFAAPLEGSPIVRMRTFDAVKELLIECGSMSDKLARDHVERVGRIFAERNIRVPLVPLFERDELYRRTFLVTNVVYDVQYERPVSASQIMRRLEKVQKNIIETYSGWADGRVVGRSHIDQRGIVFELEEDAALFRLTYGNFYSSTSLACGNAL